MSQGTERRADVVIVTAIRLEFAAVLQVSAGAVPGSAWVEEKGPSGLPVAYRRFAVPSGARPLRVAVALAPAMGATATVNTLLPLVEKLEPRCIAMCGVCAGRRGKVGLGDVVAADRLFYHDSGKQLPDRVQRDLTTYNLRPDWKAALEAMQVVERFKDEAWFQARPIPNQWRQYRALVAFSAGAPEPWLAVADHLKDGEWQSIIAALRERGWLAASGRDLTDEGRRVVADLLLEYQNRLPDLSPHGTMHPFRLHVAPIGSGTRVIEDENVWTFVSQAMRKTLALEMEATALGELAHYQQQRRLDAVVMKAVMDFADHGRDDHFKEFAARASAECLLWFLREQVTTESNTGFDDLLAPGILPLPEGEVAPSKLVQARHGVVPWHQGNWTEILADLDAWADDAAAAVAVWLLHAEGGAGKTRLAIEWVRRRRERYDVAGFLASSPGSNWLARLGSQSQPVIIVLDYAESRADLVDLVREVAQLQALATLRCRVRVLLLARSDGDWWTALLQHDPALAAWLDHRKPRRVPPLAATTTERRSVFKAALQAFAAQRGVELPTQPHVALEDGLFSRVLYVHLAALAAVHRATQAAAGERASAPAVIDATALLEEVLDHEERFWLRRSSDRGETARVRSLARQLVGAATLRGGLASERAAWHVLPQLTDRPRSTEDDRMLALLREIYARPDCAGPYLPGLEPDLLGEAMVLRLARQAKAGHATEDDDWIERAVAADGDARAITSAFTVLGRASAQQPELVRAWAARLLRKDFDSRAVLALRAAKAVGGHTAHAIIGDVLADALAQHGSVSVAHALEQEGIPRPSVSLMRVAEWQSRTLLSDGPVAADHLEVSALAIKADRLLVHGNDLGALGQSEQASAACQEAVDLHRALAAENPAAFRPDLARSLNSLGIWLRESGQREHALAAGQEAVDLQRALASENPAAFLSDLAMSLNNLGAMLSDLGQRGPALAATEEAVTVYRTLAAHDPEAFLADLAMSLNNLGNRLGECGQRAPALAASEEAVALYHTLASQIPDAFDPGLASSLNNLSIRWSGCGQAERALAAAQEAVAVYRALAARKPEAFRADLASSLTNLGATLRACGQRALALTATEEAVDLRRALAASDPGAFRPDLAMNLNNLGTMLSEAGQRELALAASQEAVTLYRTVAVQDAHGFGPDLASSLTNLGLRLRECGRYELALATAAEAVDLRRALAADTPDAFNPDLASSLTNLGAILSECGQHALALSATDEAVALYRTLAGNAPDTFRPELATALSNLGAMLLEMEQRELALAATQEAVALYRALATENPDGFRSDLIGCLNSVGAMLLELGREREGRHALREAADLNAQAVG